MQNATNPRKNLFFKNQKSKNQKIVFPIKLSKPLREKGKNKRSYSKTKAIQTATMANQGKEFENNAKKINKGRPNQAIESPHDLLHPKQETDDYANRDFAYEKDEHGKWDRPEPSEEEVNQSLASIRETEEFMKDNKEHFHQRELQEQAELQKKGEKKALWDDLMMIDATIGQNIPKRNDESRSEALSKIYSIKQYENSTEEQLEMGLWAYAISKEETPLVWIKNPEERVGFHKRLRRFICLGKKRESPY